MYATLKTLLLPPANLILLLAFGLVAIGFGRRKLGMTLIGFVIVVIYVMSAPVAADFIARLVQREPPLSAELAATPDAGAIVVLSAGYAHAGREYDGATIDDVTLQRLRYAAHLWRLNHLPILVTGGVVDARFPPLADLMRTALETDFAVPVQWVENQSLNTMQNGEFSARILKEAGIQRILLVTHASHMPRSRAVFEGFGLTVVAAPTDFAAPLYIAPDNFVPRISRFADSYYALYELAGQAWYALRYP